MGMMYRMPTKHAEYPRHLNKPQRIGCGSAAILILLSLAGFAALIARI